MVQTWPVKIPVSCYDERLPPSETLATQVPTLATFSPAATGAVYPAVISPTGSDRLPTPAHPTRWPTTSHFGASPPASGF